MAMTTVVRKILPSAYNDGDEASNLGDRYGAQIVQPLHGGKQAVAEQGNYFVASNPTPGTGIAMSQSITSFNEAAGAVGVVLYLRNTETSAVNASKRIYPDYLMLRSITTAPTSATDWYMAGVLDYNPTLATGGSAITPVNVNGDSSLASIATMRFGVLTTPVPSSRRLLFNRLLRAQVPVVMDQYKIIFGGIEGGASIVTGAGAQNLIFNAPPIVIGPSQNLLLHMWGTAFGIASATWEFEMGWIEK